jgi:ATP-binding cassette, subfamily A (ABC1), member 3
MTAKMKAIKGGTDTAAVVFFLSLAIAVLCAMVVGHVVSERTSKLKHMQTMTGLRLDAYWVGNFIWDFIKFLPVILVMSIVQHYLCALFDEAIPTIIVFPLGALPFLYCLSFLFDSESAAQTMTLFTFFLMGSIMCGCVFILRVNPKLWDIGDILNWTLRLFPGYAIANSVFFCQNGTGLSYYRLSAKFGKAVSSDPYELYNNPADMLCILAIGVIWSGVLIAIENGLQEKVEDLYEQSIKHRYPPPNELLDIDEDVRVEENRVRKKNDN